MQDETGKSEQNVTKDMILEKNTSESSNLLKISEEIDVPFRVIHLLQFRDEKSEPLTLKKVIEQNEYGNSYQRYTLNNEKNVEQNQDTIVPEKDKHDEDQSKQKQVQPEEQSNPYNNTPDKKDKNEVDQSKQEEVQPKGQSNPEKNSLGQKKPKDDARITTLKDKMQEIHLDIERNPKRTRGKKGAEKEKSPKEKTVEDVFPKTTNLKEGQEGKQGPEKEKSPKEKTVQDVSPKTTNLKDGQEQAMPKPKEMKDTTTNETQKKGQMASDFVEIEDETHLLNQNMDKDFEKISEETAASSQKSEQSTKKKSRYKMVARKNKNKSPVVPSGRITRSQDVLLDESGKEGQKQSVEAAEETMKKGAPAKYSAAPLKKMPGAPAEKVVQGGKKKTAEEVKKTSKVAGKRKAVVSPAKKNAGKRKNIQVPSDEPSQDPIDESSTDSGDDSEESIYKAEPEPVSEEDDELEEDEEEIIPKKKQAKRGKAQKLVKAKA
ncbi:DNA ligase 1-like [Chenopodium quinoa]|uniref:DNA ligase 1-like n=1 Tax=Chenopodium quinoa TaxID=63459 RepID=UPI000B77C5C1|nr:DNA ligase 1-like [Chenopodium quinoa]